LLVVSEERDHLDNYFDSELSSSSSGVEGATEVEEREVTADAAGEVAEGAVAD